MIGIVKQITNGLSRNVFELIRSAKTWTKIADSHAYCCTNLLSKLMELADEFVEYVNDINQQKLLKEESARTV